MIIFVVGWAHDGIDSAGPELYLRNVVVSFDVAGAWNRSRTSGFGVHGVHEYGVVDDTGITGLLDWLLPETTISFGYTGRHRHSDHLSG